MIAASLLAAPPFARADCIDDAATRHQVNALVLRAIGWHESRLQPLAIGHNANGTSDIGAFQINDIHLPTLAQLGVSAKALTDGCVSADVAAWHYRRQVDAFGNTWTAVGAYHSRTPTLLARYANQVAAVLMQWHAMPAGPPPFDLATTQARSDPPPRRHASKTPRDTTGSRRHSGDPTASRSTPSWPRETVGEGVDAFATARAIESTPLAFRPSAR